MMRIKRVNLRTMVGFTLVETTIVLALIGLLTTILVAGTGPQLKNERFAGQVRVFADDLRQAQTHAYSVQTGTCPGTPGTCFWRGNLLSFTQQNVTDASYDVSLLQGDDYAKYTTSSGQIMGIKSALVQQPGKSINGIHLSAISIVGQLPLADGTQVSLAFLAPDGKGYVCSAPSGDTTTCGMTSVGWSNYMSQSVKFTLSDTATKLISYVTYDPATGSITITAS